MCINITHTRLVFYYKNTHHIGEYLVSYGYELNDLVDPAIGYGNAARNAPVSHHTRQDPQD